VRRRTSSEGARRHSSGTSSEGARRHSSGHPSERDSIGSIAWAPPLAVALVVLSVVGCAAPGSPAADAADRGVAVDTGEAADAASCSEPLFGRPGEHTGLDASQCAPRCGCGGGAWQPRIWNAEALTALRAAELLDPPAIPAVDPYRAATPTTTPPPEARCAVRMEPGLPPRYRLLDVDSEAAAAAAGADVTHTGRCGLCSGLTDLAVYAGSPDLTGPVRQCGLVQLSEGFDASVLCLRGLGFSVPCATIWAWNVEHTREACLQACMSLLKAPSHLPDGTLNACLACDEQASGPVFKAVAGRTRRNSGLPSGLCRPCAAVARVEHGYLEGLVR
jgi:hypothetical protein